MTRPPDYPAMTVESSRPSIDAGFSPARVRAGTAQAQELGAARQVLRSSAPRATSSTSAVFAVLLDARPRLHYIPAAIGSFLVAVTNNYAWNRLWTFRAQRGGVAYQGMRFLVVSTLALVANLVVLHSSSTLGLGEFVAQAIAIVLVTPVNFVGNKLWSFGPRR